MPLPQITHLQFLVLGAIMASKKPGCEVREALKQQGVRKSGPAFYQLMARMEDAKLVKGWYEQKVIDGQIIKQRWYRLTASGARAWHATRDFYIESSAAALGAKGGLANA